MQQQLEMDTEVENKENDRFSDALEKELEFFTNVAMKIYNDALFLDGDCDAFRTEIGSEIPLPDPYSQNGKECSTQHPLKQIQSETVTHNNNCETDTKIEIASQKEGELISEDVVMEVMNYNTDNVLDNNIDITVEPLWFETETASVWNYNEDGEYTPLKSPRLCTEEASGDSNGNLTLLGAEVSGKEASVSFGKDYPGCEIQEGDVIKILPEENYVHSEQPLTHSGGREINNTALAKYKSERPHKCDICERRFIKLSYLKQHILKQHESENPHKCEICEKSFAHLSHLKEHILIHEGKKPFKCEMCEKSFVRLTKLKRHILTHEGIKPHKCEICERSFSDTSNLKSHMLTHVGKKLHTCEICNKSFTRSSDLKRHFLTHEDKRSHKCEICEKSFKNLSTLKLHNLTHEGNNSQV